MDIETLVKDIDVIEPETLINMFPLMDSIDRQKIYVNKILKESRAAYEDLNVFENAVLVLNDISPDIGKMEGCKPIHIWKALDLIKDMHDDLELAHEVLLYIKMIHKEYGYEFYPPNIGLDEDNKIYEAVNQRALSGPFPLGEDFLGLQAAKLLKIQTYLGE